MVLSQFSEGAEQSLLACIEKADIEAFERGSVPAMQGIPAAVADALRRRLLDKPGELSVALGARGDEGLPMKRTSGVASGLMLKAVQAIGDALGADCERSEAGAARTGSPRCKPSDMLPGRRLDRRRSPDKLQLSLVVQVQGRGLE